MKKRIIIILTAIILFLALLAGAGILFLSISEYKPAASESVAINPALARKPVRNEVIDLLIWNTGYASLGEKEDFFMDGGRGVRPAKMENVEENLTAIKNFIINSEADIVFLQEVDLNSKRSYNINQVDYLSKAWGGSSAFALNFKCPFVPVPFPEFIGKVESGLLSLLYFSGTAERIALPSPFKWPERAAQLKRCLLITRVPLQEAGAELVLINLHLEAYDSGGEGRIAQTALLAQTMKAEYEKGNYCVAGGDFNQVFPSYKDAFPIEENKYFTPGIVDEGLFGQGWVLAADPSSPTCRSLDKPYSGFRENHQFYMIDGFILSPNVRMVSVQTIDLNFKNSDHNPVKLSFSLD